MRIVFIGTGIAGWNCVERLIKEGADVAGIVTLDDKLAHTKSTFKSYDNFGRDHSIPLIKVEDINSPENVEKVRQLKPDLIVEMSWSQLVGTEILETPPLGCIGTHISMLPKARNRSPLNWAIINGETKWGNTLFYLVERPDAGDIIDQREFDITPDDDIKSAYDKASALGIEMVADALPLIERGECPRTPQDDSLATFMPKRRPEDGVIDWSKDALQVYNLVRAVTHPFPGAFTFLDGKKVFVWKAEVPKEGVESSGEEGEII